MSRISRYCAEKEFYPCLPETVNPKLNVEEKVRVFLPKSHIVLHLIDFLEEKVRVFSQIPYLENDFPYFRGTG